MRRIMHQVLPRIGACVAVLIAVGGLALALSSRSENPTVEPPLREWGQVSGGFQLSAKLERECVGYCQPVTLNLIIRNVSEEALSLFERSPDRDFVLEVTDDLGKSAPLTRYGEIVRGATTSRMNIRRVDPKEECSYNILVNRVHDMTLPGIYSITAKYVKEMGPGHEPVVIVSNTVEVKIPNNLVRPRHE